MLKMNVKIKETMETRISASYDFLSMLNVSCQHCITSSPVSGEEKDTGEWSVAANILNKQPQIPTKGWFPIFEVTWRATTPRHTNIACYETYSAALWTHSLELGLKRNCGMELCGSEH
jgi:hypothetical protein